MTVIFLLQKGQHLPHNIPPTAYNIETHEVASQYYPFEEQEH